MLCANLDKGGGGFGGEWTYVHVWMNPFASRETTTTLLISYNPIQNSLQLSK